MKHVVLALALWGLAGTAAAAAPEVASRPRRVKVAVMDFDYGTVTDRWWGESDIGKGMAAQVVDRLVNDGTFSVIERNRLDTLLAEQDFAKSARADPGAASLARVGRVMGIRYVVAGSITRFGSEQKKYGAGAAGAALGPVGMLGFKKARTEVALTARLIDTTTGEIVASATGAGISKRGGGVSVGGLGKMASAAGLDMASEDYRTSAIGEAQDLACTELVAALLAEARNLH